MSDNTATIALGTTGTYTNSDGRRKAALVIGTPESIDPGHRIEVPNPGTVNLLVFSPAGAAYVRAGVATKAPEGDGEQSAYFTS